MQGDPEQDDLGEQLSGLFHDLSKQGRLWRE
jgi:hypothetical protein